jgi:uncharacterized protein (TIGR03437 family)
MQNKAVRTAGLFLLLVASASGQSGSVHNAAGITTPVFSSNLSSFLLGYAFLTYTPAGFQLARGSLAVINYYPEKPAATRGSINAVVSIRPVGSVTAIPAQVISADSFNITFVVPPLAPVGPAQLIYRADGDTTKWTELEVVPSSFALFGDTNGLLKAQLVANDGTVTLNQLSNPATPGQVVTLWGSGLGTRSVPSGDVSVTLGGVSQTVLYAGAAPNLPGVDQINFRVVPGTSDGCYVPLAVRYGQNSVTSMMSVLSVSNLTGTQAAGSCAHPFRLEAGDLRKLDSGGIISVDQIAIASGLQVPSAEHAARQETASVSLDTWNAAQMAARFAPPSGQGCSVIGSGIGVPTFLSRSGFFYGNSSFGPQTIGNGVSSVMLSDDNKYNATFTSPDSPLTSVPPPIFTGGQWTWKSDESALLAASQFTFNLPPPIHLNGTAPLLLRKDRDQTIAWSGSGYDSNANVTLTISGQGSAFLPLLSCLGPASAGAITIPKDLMARLDPGAVTVSVKVNGAPSANPFTLLQQKNRDSLVVLVTPISTDSRTADIQ